MPKINITKLTFLATHLNGAADSGKYSHITVDAVRREISGGDIFGFLARELGGDVDLGTFTDVERTLLSKEWRASAEAIDAQQFRVTQGGLALLVAYLLHAIYLRAVMPQG
jgi:hypothetical protein